MNYSKIEYEIKINNKTITDLAKHLDITYRGLRRKLNLKSLSIEELEKISDYLGLPVTYWFDDEVKNVTIASHNHINGNNNKIEVQLTAEIERLKTEIEMLKVELRLKNELIESLRAHIKSLMKLDK
jgi:transcriptional regulator with XRE-family HTH domain